MQTDYIKREIEKIGKIIEAILVKLKMSKKESLSELLYATKIELAEKLDIDIDRLLASGSPAEMLVARYGFNDEHLDKFAELLFDMIAPTTDKQERTGLVLGIEDIDRYLEEKSAPYSFNRHHILKELGNFKG